MDNWAAYDMFCSSNLTHAFLIHVVNVLQMEHYFLASGTAHAYNLSGWRFWILVHVLQGSG